MKKKVWIVNHYATKMFFYKNGRHYNFAKYLDKEKYDVVIVCASTAHNLDKKMEMDNFYMESSENGISWIFIKTRDYKGNSFDRVLNIFDFYRNCMRLSKVMDLPDIIIGSNVHLLACLFSVRMKKKYHIKSIVEMRDLWPEALLETRIGKHRLIVNILYKFEKCLYKNADAIVFTMEGGKDYIKEHYPFEVNQEKVFYINNGVDLIEYQFNQLHNQINDIDLKDNRIKVVYTGSISLMNGLDRILDLVEVINKKGFADKVVFLLYGGGTNLEILKETCEHRNIQNIKIKGMVDKNKIPYILSCADFTILNYKEVQVLKYGGSHNKLFEYLAAGKPVFSTVKSGYDIIEKYNCGLSSNDKDYEVLGQQFAEFISMEENEYKEKSNNAKEAAHEFDFPVLTKKLETVLQFVLEGK